MTSSSGGLTNGSASSGAPRPPRDARPADSRRPERKAEAIRAKQGIPLVPAVVNDLRDVRAQDRHPVRLTRPDAPPSESVVVDDSQKPNSR